MAGSTFQRNVSFGTRWSRDYQAAPSTLRTTIQVCWSHPAELLTCCDWKRRISQEHSANGPGL